MNLQTMDDHITVALNKSLVEPVPDHGSRDRVVVLIGLRCWGNLRRDAGNLEWGREFGGVEEGEVSLRVTWDQGGRDPITPRRVPSK
jgi:hypothetical protein